MDSGRLSIPLSFTQEVLHGGAAGATVFPMPLTMGTTWDEALVQDMYAATARDLRAVGGDLGYAPVINLFMDPRFGRHQEGFSTNPMLSARYATAAVKGLQGDNGGSNTGYMDADRVVALGKHMAGYGGAPGGLNAAGVDVNDRTLYDVYLQPWRAFAKAGGRGAMAAHNTVHDVPCHANSWLLNDVFRTEVS